MSRKSALFVILTLLFARTSYSSSAGRVIIDKRVTIQVEVVTTEREQRLGLGGRFSLREGSGLLFVYRGGGERIFWMRGMFFPIDIIWIYKGRIVHIERNVPPPSRKALLNPVEKYGFGTIADMVLEVPSGYSKKKGIDVGGICDVDPEISTFPRSPQNKVGEGTEYD